MNLPDKIGSFVSGATTPMAMAASLDFLNVNILAIWRATIVYCIVSGTQGGPARKVCQIDGQTDKQIVEMFFSQQNSDKVKVMQISLTRWSWW